MRTGHFELIVTEQGAAGALPVSGFAMISRSPVQTCVPQVDQDAKESLRFGRHEVWLARLALRRYRLRTDLWIWCLQLVP